MGIVRTVLGDIAPEQLGVVDCHEHLMIVGGPLTQADPDILLDDVEDAVQETERYRDTGGGTIVDAIPTACGRDAAALAAISRRTGVHIVATAGFHRPHLYGDLHWTCRYPVELLAEVIIEEVTEGFDRWDHSGPRIERLDIRPGVLKVATGFSSADEIEVRMVEAVARVHLATGLPILTHAEQGTHADWQLDRFEAAGVELSRVVISHMDRNLDGALHRDLIERGAYLGYDSLYREQRRTVEEIADTILQLAGLGLADRIMLGGDIGRRSMRLSGGGSGIAGLLSVFVPELQRCGVERSTIDEMLIANPARFLEVPDE